MLNVFAFGAYAHRQPLAYPQIRAHCLPAIRVVDDFARADIVVIAHSKDLDTSGADLRARLGAGQRLVLLSEEPFWDTVWGRDPLSRHQIHDTPAGPLPLTVLNHFTSRVYAFDEIPYFLLTDPHFATRYGHWFTRNAALGPADWAAHFRRPELLTSFMMVYRQAPLYEATFPGRGIRGLCNLRTEIARACDGPSTLRLGRGWQDGLPPRQSLADWHLDKFLTMNRRCRFMGAIENTHHPDYITEKLFDAYAVGAVPLYIADPGHRADVVAAPGTWVNLVGLAPAGVPDALAAFVRTMETPAFLQAYAGQHARLARLFFDPAPHRRELDRLRDALRAEFTVVLESG